MQETIIIRLVKGTEQGDVAISTSSDDTFTDTETFQHPFGCVVHLGDDQLFVHIPTDRAVSALSAATTALNCSLDDLGIGVCTGPVVDFRLADSLQAMPKPGSVPLLYPNHLTTGAVVWPIEGGKKPNAITVDGNSRKWLMPSGTYAVTKRFSSKEERRRVVATVVDGDALADCELIGFENHLNVFYSGARKEKAGLPPSLAYGLMVYLNSTAVDEHLRRFSGHTQVNATDLRKLPYPDTTALLALGEWAMQKGDVVQAEIDAEIARLTNPTHEIQMAEHRNVGEALDILAALDFPRAQQNERSALCLLAITGVTADKTWQQASAPLVGITPMMDFARNHYGKEYAPNTRETFRRQTMHQFVDAGLALYNPDKPDRPVNSPKAVYQVSPEALTLIRAFGTPN